MKPTDFAQHISYFLTRYLPSERGVSYNTIAAYRDTFVLFVKYFEECESLNRNALTLDKITKESVVGFLDWLNDSRGCSTATRNLRLAGIQSFFRYIQGTSLDNLFETQRILSMKHKRSSNSSINYLSIEGVRLLLTQPDIKTRKGRRDMVLLSLMYDIGARVQEIIDLTPESVNINRTSSIKVIGKGNKARLVPMLDAQIKHLTNYLKDNRLDLPHTNKYPLFPNSRNQKLTRVGVTYILKKYADMAREKDPELIPSKISPHSLRHSKAMHLLQAGVPLIYIRDILGHVSVQTTEIYARVETKQKIEAIEKTYIDLSPDHEKPRWKDPDVLDWLKSL